jgi:hypothetical protein
MTLVREDSPRARAPGEPFFFIRPVAQGETIVPEKLSQ